MKTVYCYSHRNRVVDIAGETVGFDMEGFSEDLTLRPHLIRKLLSFHPLATEMTPQEFEERKQQKVKEDRLARRPGIVRRSVSPSSEVELVEVKEQEDPLPKVETPLQDEPEVLPEVESVNVEEKEDPPPKEMEVKKSVRKRGVKKVSSGSDTPLPPPPPIEKVGASSPPVVKKETVAEKLKRSGGIKKK